MKAFIAIALLSLIGMGTAYAEQQVAVPLPFDRPFENFHCQTVFSNDGRATYQCNWFWIIDPDAMPDLPTLQYSQDPEDYAEKINEFVTNNPAPEIPDEVEVEDSTTDDAPITEIPDEELTAEEREIKYAVETLAECRTGLGAWAAYQEQELIQNYADKTRWEFSIRDNLSQSYAIKQILMAIEECDIMKKYADMHLIGAYELNKVLADLAGLDYLGRGPSHPLQKDVTDQSDSMVETDPVTDKDIADEIEDMEAIIDKLIEDKVFKDPDADHTGINRGGQTLGLKCQILGQPAPLGVFQEEVCPLSLYDAHILKNWESITYSDVLQLQCDNFLYIYQHKIGTHEFPVWLNHCVPKVVREG